MARPSDLVPGNCYFSIGFSDQELLFPKIQTLRFRNEKSSPETGRVWLFDDLTDEFFGDEPTAGQEEIVAIHAVDESQLYQVLDLEGLTLALRGYVAGWKSAMNEPSAPQVSAEAAADLKARVLAFLANPEQKSVVFTIKFTDEGFGLSKLPGNRLRFTLVCRLYRQPRKEALIRAVFDQSGITPEDDYLADRARERILSYVVLEEPVRIADLVLKVFQESFSMRSDDRFEYSFG